MNKIIDISNELENVFITNFMNDLVSLGSLLIMISSRFLNFCIIVLNFQFVQYLLYLTIFISTCYFLDEHNHARIEIQKNKCRYDDVHNDCDNMKIDDVVIIGLVTNCDEIEKNTVCSILNECHHFKEISMKEILVDITRQVFDMNRCGRIDNDTLYILNWFWGENQSFTSLDMRDKLFNRYRKKNFSTKSNDEILMEAFIKKIKRTIYYKVSTHIVVSDIKMYEDYEIIKCLNGSVWGINNTKLPLNLSNDDDSTFASHAQAIQREQKNNSSSNFMFDCDTMLNINNVTYGNLRLMIDDLLKKN